MSDSKTGDQTDERAVQEASAPRSWGMRLLLVLHWIIIINFAVELFYSTFMVFNVLRPEGVTGPLWQAAKTLPMDLMVKRRLYAIEGWLAIGGLAIYLAITEIGPRLRAARGHR